MWIPPTVPESILRVFTRKLSPEKYEEQKKTRPLRSEDTTWDAKLPQVTTTLVGFCIKKIATSYPQLAEKVDEANRRHRASYDATKAEWETEWAAYRRDITEYNRIIWEHDEQARRLSLEMAEKFKFEDIWASFDSGSYDDWDEPDEPILPPLHPPPLVEEPSLLTHMSTINQKKLVETFNQDEIPLDLALRTIGDQHYWKLLSRKRFPEAAVEEYNKSWKRLFVEKSLRQLIEFFHPIEGDWDKFDKELRILSLFAKGLEICHLIPCCFGVPRKPENDEGFVGDKELVGGEEDEGFREVTSLKQKQEAQKKIEAEEAKKKKTAKQNKAKKVAEAEAARVAEGEAMMAAEEAEKAAEEARKEVDGVKKDRDQLEKEAKDAKEAEKVAAALQKAIREDHSHLDMSLILPRLKRLRKLSIMFKMQEVGLGYEPRFAECTFKDCVNLAKGLKKCPEIRKLEIVRSKITDQMTKVLCRGGIRHIRHLRILNLSYNELGDEGAKAVGKLISEGGSAVHSTLHTLILTSCQIGRKGAKAIAFALTINQHLRRLTLRLNPIHNTGVKAIANGLMENFTLRYLDISATNHGASGCTLMGKMLLHNRSMREVNFSGNPDITDTAAAAVATAVHYNKNLFSLDFRLCGIDNEMDSTMQTKCHFNFLDSNFDFPFQSRLFSKKEAKFHGKKGHHHHGDEEGFTDEETEAEDEEEMDASLTMVPTESTMGFPKLPPQQMSPVEPSKGAPKENAVPPFSPSAIPKPIRSRRKRQKQRRRFHHRELVPFELEELRLREIMEDYDEELDTEFYESWLTGDRLDKYITYLEDITKEPPQSPPNNHRWLKNYVPLEPTPRHLKFFY